VTYERRRKLRDRIPVGDLGVRRYLATFLERVRLGTPNLDIVDRVRDDVRALVLAGRCTPETLSISFSDGCGGGRGAGRRYAVAAPLSFGYGLPREGGFRLATAHPTVRVMSATGPILKRLVMASLAAT
jgi:hypothetical protein